MSVIKYSLHDIYVTVRIKYMELRSMQKKKTIALNMFELELYIFFFHSICFLQNHSVGTNDHLH
jgi:hypothetical protein